MRRFLYRHFLGFIFLLIFLSIDSNAQITQTAHQIESQYKELRFSDFFKLPIGPRGLEVTPTLQSLDGKKIRISGYMARQDGETAVPGLFILSPVPVTLGDEDESFADDLPASVLYVHLSALETSKFVNHIQGLISVKGILELGPLSEIDGRLSFTRLRLEGEPLPLDTRSAQAPTYLNQGIKQ